MLGFFRIHKGRAAACSLFRKHNQVVRIAFGDGRHGGTKLVQINNQRYISRAKAIAAVTYAGPEVGCSGLVLFLTVQRNKHQRGII